MSRTPAVAVSDFEDASAEAHLELDSFVQDSQDTRDANARGSTSDSTRDEPDSSDLAIDGTTDEIAEQTPDAQLAAPSDDTSRPAISAMSDEELLEGIREQSEAHFAELYRRYFQRIYSFVYTRMRNHAETEEVVQETFLAVFRSFERYRGQSSLLSWIYGIAKNTANNSIRRSKSQADRIDLADEDDLFPRPSIGVGTPAEQLDLHRFQHQLSERLEGLADWQAEIFEMRHFENLSIPEISKRTARSSDAVRSSLYRVKRIFFEAAQANGMTTAVAGDPS